MVSFKLSFTSPFQAPAKQEIPVVVVFHDPHVDVTVSYEDCRRDRHVRRLVEVCPISATGVGAVSVFRVRKQENYRHQKS